MVQGSRSACGIADFSQFSVLHSGLSRPGEAMGPIATYGSVRSQASSYHKTNSQQPRAQLFRLSAQRGQESSLLCILLPGPDEGKGTFFGLATLY